MAQLLDSGQHDWYQALPELSTLTRSPPTPSLTDMSSSSRRIPTPALQDKYNKWREMEDHRNKWHEMEDHREQLRLKTGFGSYGGHDDLLSPGSPPESSPMSRTPSCASTTHSINDAMSNADLEDDKSQSKKRRPGRQGPLDPVAKAKTALMRKLGACENCRDRKVKVSL